MRLAPTGRGGGVRVERKGLDLVIRTEEKRGVNQ